MKHNKYICAVLAGAAMLVASCTDFDDYNEGYTGDGSATSTQTLWQNISANENLSEFASLLKKAGYDEKLKGSQFYTVWAPVNGSFGYNDIAVHDSTWLVQRFLNSHIANFNYLVSGEVNRRVHTLNEKSFVLAGNIGGCTYASKQMLTMNQPSLNGTLHTLDGYAEYFPNVYEYIFDVAGCDSLASYFKKYELSYLDKDASVEGPIVDGNQTYSDSVMITENILLDYAHFGAAIDVEDSSYTMLLPNDDAFNKAVAAVSPAFNYRDEMPYFDLSTIVTTDVPTKRSITVDAAVLKDSLTKFAIAQNLMFSNNDGFNKGVFNHSLSVPFDTLRTPAYNKLSNGYEMLSHTVGEPIQASNGEVRIVDTLAYRPWEVWNPELGFSYVATTYGATSASTYYNRVDRWGNVLARYYDVVPQSTSTEPHVYYYLNNVRAASYDVYVIFVSGTKPYKYTVGINYVKSDGTLNEYNATPPFNVTSLTTDETYQTAPNGLDTCYVGRVTFPYSYAGLASSDCAPYLRVQSARGRLGNDRKNYDNNLKIAGVLLRPVEYDEYLKKDE